MSGHNLSRGGRLSVLLCTTFYLRMGAFQMGGVERLSLILASDLRKRGCLFFNAFRKTDDGAGDDELDEHYFRENERIRITDSTTSDELTSFLARNSINVIHVQQAEFKDFMLYREAAERAGAVVIATMNEKPMADMFLLSRSFLARRLKTARGCEFLKALKQRLKNIRMKTLNTFGLCHQVVLVSRNYIPGYETLLQRELDPSGCTVIPGCASFGAYFPEIHLQQLKQKEILMVCRFEELTRRQGIMLDLFKRLCLSYESWTLRILGQGPDLPACRKKAKGCSGIVFEGWTDPQPFYRTASIYVNLSVTADAWCMSLPEAMQFALVPVVFNTSEVYSDIIEHENGGYLIEDMNRSQLESVLRKLMEDDGLRLRQARLALARSKSYSRMIYARRYHDLYLATHRLLNS